MTDPSPTLHTIPSLHYVKLANYKYLYKSTNGIVYMSTTPPNHLDDCGTATYLTSDLDKFIAGLTLLRDAIQGRSTTRAANSKDPDPEYHKWKARLDRLAADLLAEIKDRECEAARDTKREG